MNLICSECGAKAHAKNLCQKHYRRALALSRGIVVSPIRDLSLPELIKLYSVPNPNTNCWEWTKSCYSKGYGQIQSKKTYETLAHRVSYIAFNGTIPLGLMVCHKCDNPKCVNPEHLFLGTSLDNAQDRNNKNRQAKGTKIKLSKLTEHDVINIRASTTSLKILSAKYNVSMTLISKIRLRKLWSHVP